MMTTDDHIGERVTVGVIFAAGSGIRPAWFHFGGRKIKIDNTNFSWRERRGQAVLYHFSVTGGGDVYHLVFSSENLSWSMETIHGTP